MKKILLYAGCLLAFVLYPMFGFAGLPNLELSDLSGNPCTIPHWGEKNLLIFYVDPDESKQNHEFTIELEENKKAVGPDIFGFGIINLKDAPLLPNFIVTSMAKRRTEKNKAPVIADKNRIVATKWNLGDCNNKFVIMVINKAGEMVFMRKGVLTDKDKEEFYKIIPLYTGNK